MPERIERRSAPLALGLASLLAGGLLLGACSSGPSGIDSASLGPQSSFSFEDVQSTDAAGSASRRSAPTSTAAASQTTPASAVPSSALAEARQLRQSGQKAKALALLDKAAEGSPGDAAITRERGLLALEVGSLEKARSLLKTAAESGPPDWRVHSGLGSALASSGLQKEAQAEFTRALELAPDHPTILNNLALSYALDGRHDQAERLLRRASQSPAAKPEAKQNLALLLGLKGQTEDARKVAEGVLSPDQARSNASYAAQLATATGGSSPAVASPQRSADARGPGEAAPVYRLGGPAQ